MGEEVIRSSASIFMGLQGVKVGFEGVSERVSGAGGGGGGGMGWVVKLGLKKGRDMIRTELE